MSQLGQDTEQEDEGIDEQIDRRLPSEQTIWGLHFLSSRSSIDSNVMLTPESCGSPRELPYAHMDIQPPLPFLVSSRRNGLALAVPIGPRIFPVSVVAKNLLIPSSGSLAED